MSLMTEALDRISAYCNLNAPNRTREEVERQLSFFPFNLPNEVYEYYQWAGAPTGNRFSGDWDLHDRPSNCRLERFLGTARDLIYFLSPEEAERSYPNYPGNTDIGELKGLPFVSYENGILVIAGSETPIETAPVLLRENNHDSLWFPSLTNMMWAVAESLEAIGTLVPNDRELWDTIAEIARKYGSPQGMIVTN